MSERRCSDRAHEGTNPLPESEFYTSPRFVCKECMKRRARVRMAAFREEIKEYGLSPYATAADLQAARAELATPRYREATLERVEREQQPNAGEMFLDLNNPPPVWRDLTNCFLRPQTKVSSWKTA